MLHEAHGGARRLRVLLAPDVDGPAVARRALRALPLGELEDDVLLLVSELVTNAIVHAGLAPHESIEVTATCDGGMARVEVRDGGSGSVPDAPSDGFGLRMVAAAAERWGIERGSGTCVWFEVARAGNGSLGGGREVGRGGFEPPSDGL